METFQRTISPFKVVWIKEEFLKTLIEYWTRWNLERFLFSPSLLAFLLRPKNVFYFRNPPRNGIFHNLSPVSHFFNSYKSLPSENSWSFIWPLMLTAAAKTWFSYALYSAAHICHRRDPSQLKSIMRSLLDFFSRLNNEIFPPLFVGRIFQLFNEFYCWKFDWGFPMSENALGLELCRPNTPPC